jgi:two-component system phosphate regulon sensor histidine kinase PhoR
MRGWHAIAYAAPRASGFWFLIKSPPLRLIFAGAGMMAGGVIVMFAGQTGLWIDAVLAIILACLTFFLRPDHSSGEAQSLESNKSAGALPHVAREVFEGLPDPLLLAQSSGRVVFANKAMRALIGIGAEAKHVSAVLRTPSVLQAVERTAATGEPASVEFMLHVPVERHYQAYVARTGEVPHLTAVLLHDLTAMKRAEEARADFIANASHELRTPLAAVSGFIDTLRGHAKDDEAAREKFLGIMSVEAGRMRRLIDDLLSLTRIELNEHVPPSGRVDVTGVIRDAVAVLGPLAEVDRVTITVDAASNLPLVVGERDELIQLFQNLIHNAVKYGKTGGNVWVTIGLSEPAPGRHGAGAMISVAIRDDGEGIPREALPRLTERFYRVDVQRSRERGGTGLGLAIVKHIVNRHQGRIQVESQPGEGSQFTVFLPAAPADRAADAAVTELI